MTRVYSTYHPSDLRNSNDSEDLRTAAESSRQYWDSAFNEKSEDFQFVAGEQYTEAELRRYRKKHKVPITFNQLTTSRRTIMGHMITNRNQADFIPRGSEDSEQADLLSTLAHFEAYNQNDRFRDPEIIDEAWMGGWSNTLIDVDVQPGRKPKLRTQKLGPFSVVWDPASKQIITRDDARFLDIIHGKSIDELMELFPEYKKVFKDAREHGLGDVSTYDQDRASDYYYNPFLTTDYYNGQVKVIERYYKVVRQEWYYHDALQKKDVIVKNIQKFKAKVPGVQLARRRREYLYLAIICPAITQYINTSSGSNHKAKTGYLYNAEYHCRPHRDSDPDRIIWPVVEMVAEHVNGRIMSFVRPQKDPIRTFNALVTNILESAKHSAASSYVMDKSAFVSEEEAKKAAMYRGDSNQTFQVNKGRVNDAMAPLMPGGTNSDTSNGINLAKEFLMEVSSTPPATQGWGEGSGVSGTLNQQRIEQAFLQLQPLLLNFIAYQKRRLELRYYYWRTYYRDEKVIRLVDPFSGLPTGEPQVLNEVSAQMNPETQEIDVSILRDPAVGEFDVAISESSQSPVRRYQTQEQIMHFLRESGIAQSDPEIARVLTMYWLDLSDADAKLKEQVKQSQDQQAEAAQNDQSAQIATEQAGADLEKTQIGNEKLKAETEIETLKIEQTRIDNDQKEMDLAQQEAEQTVMSNAGPNLQSPPQEEMSALAGISPQGPVF